MKTIYLLFMQISVFCSWFHIFSLIFMKILFDLLRLLTKVTPNSRQQAFEIHISRTPS